MNEPARPQEQLLLELLPEIEGQRVLCTSLGLAQFARAAAGRLGQSDVHCHFLDLYQADLARQSAGEMPANLRIECAADFPALEFDFVALPLSYSGEAELARDWLQAGHERLRLGGQMAATTDNTRDVWLGQQMEALFDRVVRRPGPHGTAYLATKTRPLKKLKNFACEFAFRDQGQLLHAVSRPGVFAHRRIDPGARQILNAMRIEPGDRVLDIGCGSGVLSLAASVRAAGVTVHALDSNARAVACVSQGAERNARTNIVSELNASGDYAGAGTFQLVLANPPYYAKFEIAQRFLLWGLEALMPGGRILVVTKMPHWYAENMSQWFDEVQIQESKSYWIASGRRPLTSLA